MNEVMMVDKLMGVKRWLRNDASGRNVSGENVQSFEFRDEYFYIKKFVITKNDVFFIIKNIPNGHCP